MIRKKNFILLMFLFALLQVSLLPYLRLYGTKPDLFLICVVVASLYFDVESALLISLLCGILKDIFSVNVFGLNTFFMPVFSFLLMKVSRKLALEDTPVLCAAIFLTTFFYAIVSRIALGYLGTVVPFWAFLRISLIESLYTAAIFPLVFLLIKKIARL
ncbi:MAG: rod shape-determining protein MreD [Candidatus Omnitrophica bacterium]|nr:rod shape-determining protein MreD [Candidatus Omnitrophota bacterium]